MRRILSIVFVISFILGCSPEDSNDENKYKITINGILDGDFSDYPDPTKNSIQVEYIFDNSSELQTYSKNLTNEDRIEESKIIKANNLIGTKISIDQEKTKLYYIEIKIEKVNENEILVEKKIDERLKFGDSFELIYNITENTTTLRSN